MCSIQNILHLYSFKLNLATLIPPNTYNELKMEGYQKGGGMCNKAACSYQWYVLSENPSKVLLPNLQNSEEAELALKTSQQICWS